MPRFAILEHDWPYPHWDLLLEAGPRLRAWRVQLPPAVGTVLPAEVIPDHRLLYLDYEGPISGDRGSVRRWDVGMFEWVSCETERVVVDLSGTVLVGMLEISVAIPRSAAY